MQKIVDLPNGRLLMVKVPTIAFGLDVNTYANSAELMYMLDIAEVTDSCSSDETLITKPIPFGRWQLLGRPGEITEEKARGIVEQQRGGGYFKNYEMKGSLANYGTFILPTSKESLQSLITSNGFNPDETVLLFEGNK